MEQPLVSILIPAYNADRTIAVAIKSCISQTYTNTEILVLNDGSVDYTIAEINKFGRIKFINHAKNAGIASSRNRLLTEAKGEYVAWLDADDSMVPNRIEAQVNYLLKNPAIDIVGSWILTDSKSIATKKIPIDDKLIRAHLWFKNCMIQPSIMSKNFYVKEDIFYNSEYDYMEDYELWFRLLKTKKFANVPKYLMKYHMPTSGNIEQKLEDYKFEEKLNKLWDIKWEGINIGISDRQKQVFQEFLYKFNRLKWREIKDVKQILSKLKNRDNELMIHYYRLLLFTRMIFWKKIMHIDLLFSIIHYARMKYKYLI